jgi:hypothetical protein
MRLHNILLLSFLSLFVIAACNMFNEPAHNNPNGNITLNVEDASCTEAWIEVKFAGVEFPAELRFYINDSLAESLTAVKDTLLYIEGLQPSRTYRLKAKAVRPQETVAKSAEAEVTTMDTTSHDFTWQTFTFGGSGGSSWLNDVAIINENDIWAVGEINIADTTNPNGYTTYNAVHWNGQEWELKRIDGNGYPRNTVYAFNENDVWFDGFIKWNGYEYSVHINNFPLEPNGDGWRVYGMWGTSSSDFYIVGEHGNIAHYNGTSWEKIESGTEMPITDIWGDYNEITGQYEVYATASDFVNYEIIEIIGTTVTKRITGAPPQGQAFIQGIWCDAPYKYYIACLDLWETNKIGNPNDWELVSDIPNGRCVDRITADGKNNVWVVGSFGELMKFNGIRWKSYRDILGESHGFSDIAVKGNLAVTLSSRYTAKVIVIHAGN